MKKARLGFSCMILIMGLCLCTACAGRNTEQQGTAWQIYFVKNDYHIIVVRESVCQTRVTVLLFVEMLDVLARIP